jgi:hypothetical protein
LYVSGQEENALILLGVTEMTEVNGGEPCNGKEEASELESVQNVNPTQRKRKKESERRKRRNKTRLSYKGLGSTKEERNRKENEKGYKKGQTFFGW